jgi:hypothetical protein
MIREVYVLKRATGEVVIHKTFSRRGVDEAVFSGFYSALNAFAEELGHGGIETINLGEVSFYFLLHKVDDILFAVATDKAHDAQDAQQILTEIKLRFIEKYQETLSNWDGNPAPFSDFSRDIEVVVAESRRAEGEALFAIPFCLDSKNINLEEDSLTDLEMDSSLVLDSHQELAAVYLLAEDIRQSTRGLKHLKKGCYQFFSKLLWPLWIVREASNGRIAILDGLVLNQHAVERGNMPSTSRYEALLKVDTNLEFLAGLEKLQEDIKASPRTSPFETYLLKPDFSKLIRKLGGLASTKAEYAAPLPPKMVQSQSLHEKSRFYDEAVQSHVAAARQWDSFRTHFQEQVREWTRRIVNEFGEMQSYYETRRENLVQEIDRNLAELSSQEATAIKEAKEWWQGEETTLVERLRSSLEPVDSDFVQQRDALSQLIKVDPRVNPNATQFMDEMRDVLDTLDKSFSSELRDKIKDRRRLIQQSQKDLGELNREAEEKIANIRNEFAELVRQEKARLDALDQERDQKLKEIRDRQETLESLSTDIQDLIQDQITECQRRKALFEEYLLEPEALLPTDTVLELQIPFYVLGFQRDNETTHLVVVPPLFLADLDRRVPRNLEQRDAPVTELSTNFLTFLKEKIETSWEENPEFAEVLERLAQRNNLLRDPEVEVIIYQGLHKLYTAELIPERLHTQTKLSCIEAFRVSPNDE